MSDTLPIHRLVRRKELLRMPQEGFSRGGWRLWYPHFGHGHTPKDGFCGQRHSKISRDGRRCGRCRPCGRKRTRPQATWKTAQTAVFHSAPTDHRFLQEEREQRRTLHVCQSDCLNRGVHPTRLCPKLCPRRANGTQFQPTGHTFQSITRTARSSWPTAISARIPRLLKVREGTEGARRRCRRHEPSAQVDAR
jgi:hypothetical protein